MSIHGCIVIFFFPLMHLNIFLKVATPGPVFVSPKRTVVGFRVQLSQSYFWCLFNFGFHWKINNFPYVLCFHGCNSVYIFLYLDVTNRSLCRTCLDCLFQLLYKSISNILLFNSVLFILVKGVFFLCICVILKKFKNSFFFLFCYCDGNLMYG